MKKIIYFLLALTMIIGLAACNSADTPSNTDADTPPAAGGSGTQGSAPSSGGTAIPLAVRRDITIGTWYSDLYYTSDHQSIYDNPLLTNEYKDQMKLDNMREIEKKYNITLRFINLTWAGVMESINTSIMAGAPDCDIYMADLQFGVPAVFNGYAQPIESYVPADSDVLKDQKIMKHLNLMDDPNNYLFTPVELNAEGYPLGFNVDMIKAANLPDPRDLYDSGEWTWDVWLEQLKVLTKDTNGDSVTDVYGYGGYWTNMLDNLLFANNTHIAGDKTEGVSLPATLQVFELFNTIYNVDKTARPWIADDWESNLTPFVDGQMAFFLTKDWILQGKELSFELGVVPWPWGPNGSKESTQKTNISGNWHFIPVGSSDPELLYRVFYDYTNYFKDDLSIRDEDGIADWQKNMYVTERNFEMAMENGKTSGFDLWGSLGLGDAFSMVPIMDTTKTPAQVAEEAKLVVQDKLNAFFGN